MLASSARGCVFRLSHQLLPSANPVFSRLCTAAAPTSPASPVERLTPHQLQKLFSHLAPLVVRANSEHASLLHHRSNSTFTPSQHARLTQLAPIAHLTDALTRLHHHHNDAVHILNESNPSTDADMHQLARDEIQTLNLEKHRTAVHIISHLLRMQPNHTTQHTAAPANSAIVEIRAGTGGDEAALFVADLHAMYHKFALRNKWNARILSQSTTTLGGLRELILRLSGPAVYDTIRLEAGVHRVQRVPATETGGRVHTSTASVAVLRDDTSMAKRLTLREADVKIDVYRASGAGGQHVNKTESAVRATHIPTGLVATSQEDRSQHRNKALALEALAARLAAKHAAEKAASKLSERRAQLGSTMGERSDRIRTYNFPQRRVTDHRIVPSAGLVHVIESAKTLVGEKSVPLDGVLQGGVELDRLIGGVSRAQQLEQLHELVEDAKQLRCAQSDELGERFGIGLEMV
ncbi:Peptide chain release factor 1 [Gracilariopsis chorda]|uniref:Peptide chain release factor 1 n=1 Tax=Gracilariopsis chorda TaxID=448386 RepID=A0A2V3IGL1_9FLOR|nr:Peptide chain release factor 1 [Gracilariopsis chorda]|eukprot:PXF41236.1 Peptide chain release factor 1 [Gracilariopsis chorda]